MGDRKEQCCKSVGELFGRWVVLQLFPAIVFQKWSLRNNLEDSQGFWTQTEPTHLRCRLGFKGMGQWIFSLRQVVHPCFFWCLLVLPLQHFNLRLGLSQHVRTENRQSCSTAISAFWVDWSKSFWRDLCSCLRAHCFFSLTLLIIVAVSFFLFFKTIFNTTTGQSPRVQMSRGLSRPKTEQNICLGINIMFRNQSEQMICSKTKYLYKVWTCCFNLSFASKNGVLFEKQTWLVDSEKTKDCWNQPQQQWRLMAPNDMTPTGGSVGRWTTNVKATKIKQATCRFTDCGQIICRWTNYLSGG